MQLRGMNNFETNNFVTILPNSMKVKNDQYHQGNDKQKHENIVPLSRCMHKIKQQHAVLKIDRLCLR